MKSSNLNKESLLKICAGKDETITLECSFIKAPGPSLDFIVSSYMFLAPEEMAKFSDAKEACLKMNEPYLKDAGYEDPNTYINKSGIYEK